MNLLAKAAHAISNISILILHIVVTTYILFLAMQDMPGEPLQTHNIWSVIEIE